MSTERRRISQIFQIVSEIPALPAFSAGRQVGIEALDDCAVIGLGSVDLVVGSDFVRGTRFHLFELGIISWEDIGWFLMAANASDLAAMGASPLGATLILRYTTNLTDEEFGGIMRGVARACREFEMPLLGGDTGSFQECVLSATALGVVEPGTALLRSQGAAGDHLYVTGEVGRAGAAIAYFRRGREEGVCLPRDLEEELAESWKRAMPAVKQGIALRTKKLSRCAIDTSDGLKAAVRQLAEASSLDAILDAESIPIDSIARKVAEEMGVDPLAMAVGDSVDFRLVFSSNPVDEERLREEFSDRGWSLFRIGVLKESTGGTKVQLSMNGQIMELPGVEWSQSDRMAIDELREGRDEKRRTSG